MRQTIGNPLSWSIAVLRDTGRHFGAVADRVAGAAADAAHLPTVRHIDIDDLEIALRRGFDDFAACRSDVIFLCLLYPMIGLGLVAIAFNLDLLPLVFPVMAGFALIGPVAGIGLYEMSRRRELGLEVSWADAFAVLRSPSFGAIFVLGLILVAIFVVWLLAAGGIYALTLGPEPPASLGAFVRDVFTTAAGWAMIVIGMSVGFLFAVLVLVISVVSFPLLLDRNISLSTAVLTSIRVSAVNPRPIATWGLIVALGLAIGSLPVFFGLIIVFPVLGHATWHLYRRAVVPEPAAPPLGAEPTSG